MGRPKKPAKQKRLEGNAGHRRIVDEPEPPAYAGGVPAGLAGVALMEWHRLSAMLTTLQIFTEADLGVLEVYCVSFASYREATEKLKKGGQVIKTAFGQAQRSPWAAAQKDAWSMMEKAASKLGLSPADRAKLATSPDKERPEDEEFFANGEGAPGHRPGASA